MIEHTKEPWYIYEDAFEEDRTVYAGEDLIEPRTICQMLDTVEGLEGDCPEAIANARRIVACVNACASVPTERLEQIAARGHRLNPNAVLFGDPS